MPKLLDKTTFNCAFIDIDWTRISLGVLINWKIVILDYIVNIFQWWILFEHIDTSEITEVRLTLPDIRSSKDPLFTRSNRISQDRKNIKLFLQWLLSPKGYQFSISRFSNARLSDINLAPNLNLSFVQNTIEDLI
jgi:hypothetical protein